MHRFKFKGSKLHAEEVAVSRVAKAIGTPFYLYSIGTFLDHFLKLKRAFSDMDVMICFAMKSNSNLTVLKKLVQAGAGLDIVSGGELFRARKVGANPRRIVYASVGKTEEEIAAAIKAGILFFNVESSAELAVINRVACQLDKIQDISLRINPEVKLKTHRYITTGSKENKFGLDMTTAFRLYVEAYRYPFLRFSGVHLHIGSQITEAGPFIEAIKKAGDFISNLRASGIFIETINIGGGLGIIYSQEKPQSADEFARAVKPILKPLNLRVILEPGRFISGNSGILVTKVLNVKTAKEKTFVVVDAGMNDLIRPSLYDAYHEVVHVIKKSGRSEMKSVDIVGPVCESGDFFAKDRKLAPAEAGDPLAVMSCGAYGYVMSSNYNSRPRVPEVVVRGRRFFVAKRRETYEDLVRGEKILDV